jgi:two-component system sensor histidine kinase TctE
MTSSISRQLVFWLAVPLMLLALCGALVHYFNSVAPQRHQQRPPPQGRHQCLDGACDYQGWRRYPSDGASPDSVRYALRDSQGHLLMGDTQLPSEPLTGLNAQVFAMTQIDERRLRTLTTRFDTKLGMLMITVADARPPGPPAARYGFMSTLLWDFVQLDITLVLVWVGIQLGLRPTKKLRDEIAERSPQDLRPIAESSVPRELAPIAVTLNRLFLMLRTSVQSQQQFIANTAHQLRTPITGMQAQLDLLAAEPAAEPIKNRLLTLQEGIRQLAHSANQLLTLARADPAVNIAARKHSVDLSVTVAEIAARFFDRALQSNIDLGVDVKPVTVFADASLLDDLLSNLVDNALKYTPSGGSVTVSAGELNGRPYLAVEDTGPGIPEAERQHVRQRFYRLPNSPGHGSGLGLAIVEEIAQLYEATLTIGPGPGNRGTRMHLQFP